MPRRPLWVAGLFIFEGNMYDKDESQQGKDEGMDRAAENRAENLAVARAIAREIANRYGTCNADQVGQVMEERNLPSLGPAAGSIFKGNEWKFTGVRIRSAKVANHARELKVWRLNRSTLLEELLS